MKKVFKIFILEDEIDGYRHPIKDCLSHHDLTIAKSRKEAEKLWSPPYDFLLLDHDMEGRYEKSEHPNTGYQFLKWMLTRYKGKPIPTILHSQNGPGRRNMYLLLTKDYGWTQVQEVPYGTTYVQALKGEFSK